MTKSIDRDLKVLRVTVRALLTSSSPRMLRANMEYLWDRFVRHPNADDLAQIADEEAP